MLKQHKPKGRASIWHFSTNFHWKLLQSNDSENSLFLSLRNTEGSNDNVHFTTVYNEEKLYFK